MSDKVQTNHFDKFELQQIIKSAEKRADAKRAGHVGATIASILAILSIFIMGVVFLPIAIIIAIFSTFNAFTYGNTSGMLYNFLAWILIAIGAFTSPVFLLLVASLGFSFSGGSISDSINTINLDSSSKKILTSDMYEPDDCSIYDYDKSIYEMRWVDGSGSNRISEATCRTEKELGISPLNKAITHPSNERLVEAYKTALYMLRETIDNFQYEHEFKYFCAVNNIESKVSCLYFIKDKNEIGEFGNGKLVKSENQTIESWKKLYKIAKTQKLVVLNEGVAKADRSYTKFDLSFGHNFEKLLEGKYSKRDQEKWISKYNSNSTKYN